jgi:hypothetical protein
VVNLGRGGRSEDEVSTVDTEWRSGEEAVVQPGYIRLT